MNLQIKKRKIKNVKGGIVRAIVVCIKHSLVVNFMPWNPSHLTSGGKIKKTLKVIVVVIQSTLTLTV